MVPPAGQLPPPSRHWDELGGPGSRFPAVALDTCGLGLGEAGECWSQQHGLGSGGPLLLGVGARPPAAGCGLEGRAPWSPRGQPCTAAPTCEPHRSRRGPSCSALTQAASTSCAGPVAWCSCWWGLACPSGSPHLLPFLEGQGHRAFPPGLSLPAGPRGAAPPGLLCTSEHGLGVS